jgi:AcrR family transcriptional regulator
MAVTLSKGERTRQRLLDAAVRRFAAEGFRRASVSDIARDAGVSPAAAYAYFANKEAFFKAAVDTDAAALIERARLQSEPDRSMSDWLAMPARLRALLPEHPLARRVLGAQEPEVLPQLLELPSLAELRAQLVADLRAAQRRGEARTDIDVEAMALGLETIVLALLAMNIHVPVDEARATGVLTVLDAASRPSS